MSASPSPIRARKFSSSAGLTTLGSALNRVTEPDESVVPPSTAGESRDPVPPNTPQKSSQAFRPRWLSALINLVLFSLIGAGVLAGAITIRIFFALWEQVTAHSQQLAEHQATIQQLRGTRSALFDQAGHLQSLDTSTAALFALLEAQGKRLEALESGQAGLQGQIHGMKARWQQQRNELPQSQAPLVTTLTPKSEKAPSAPETPAAPVPPASDKHNETFSPDLKPTPQAQAHMADNGLVVWLTPRPGFEKPVPTSVIGYVRGLGMLVHDWDDHQHYFITDSGSWMADQR
jgi:hypothetical protein